MLKDCVPNPIHPTEAFDMIVGTSTGGIIALGLLAGNKAETKVDGKCKRERMTIEQVMDIYIR